MLSDVDADFTVAVFHTRRLELSGGLGSRCGQSQLPETKARLSSFAKQRCHFGGGFTIQTEGTNAEAPRWDVFVAARRLFGQFQSPIATLLSCPPLALTQSLLLLV